MRWTSCAYSASRASTAAVSFAEPPRQTAAATMISARTRRSFVTVDSPSVENAPPALPRYDIVPPRAIARALTRGCPVGPREAVISPPTALHAMEAAAVNALQGSRTRSMEHRKETRHGEGEEPGPRRTAHRL